MSDEDARLIRPKLDKPCLVCGERIGLNVKKCHKCGSFQDWRKYTDLIPAPLPWIAALIGATVALIPLLNSAFHQPDSVIEDSFPYVNFDNKNNATFDIIVTNHGDRPAVMDDIFLSFTPSFGIPQFWLILKEGGNNRIVSAGSTRVVSYDLPISDNGEKWPLLSAIDEKKIRHVFNAYYMTSPPPNSKCRMTLTIINFHRGKSQLNAPLDCNIIGTISWLILGRPNIL